MDSIIYQCCVYSLSVATPIKVIDEIPTFDEGKTKTNGKISFEFDSTLTDYRQSKYNFKSQCNFLFGISFISPSGKKACC